MMKIVLDGKTYIAPDGLDDGTVAALRAAAALGVAADVLVGLARAGVLQ